MSEFALYPEERHWWSFNDYRCVLTTVRRLKPHTVVEFGPGSSTLALIEGGAGRIDSFEDKPEWREVYQARLAEVYPNVAIHSYEWADPLVIKGFARRRWDLALIDGPHTTPKRPAVIAWCFAHCEALLIPTEDYHCTPILRPVINELAAKYKRQVEYLETGPLSGGFAVVTKC